MIRKCFLISVFFLLFLLSACNLPGRESPTATPGNPLSTRVAATLTSFFAGASPTPSQTSITATPTETPPPTMTYTSTQTLIPSLTPSLTRTQVPSQTPIPKPGTIAGGISGYPYGSVPSLAIVAYLQTPPYNYSYWITAPGDTYFSMTSSYLIPGKYLLVAYDAGGHRGGCTTIVEVKSEETSNCDITDWSGSYPDKPTNVPNP
jgi:hypothetical protein